MMIMNPKSQESKNQKIRKQKGKSRKKTFKLTSQMRRTGTMNSLKMTKQKLDKIRSAERTYNRKKIQGAAISEYQNENQTLVHSQNNSFMENKQLDSLENSFSFDGKNPSNVIFIKFSKINNRKNYSSPVKRIM